MYSVYISRHIECRHFRIHSTAIKFEKVQFRKFILILDFDVNLQPLLSCNVMTDIFLLYFFPFFGILCEVQGPQLIPPLDGFTGDMALLNSNIGKKGHRTVEKSSYSFKNSSSSRVILKVKKSKVFQHKWQDELNLLFSREDLKIMESIRIERANAHALRV